MPFAPIGSERYGRKNSFAVIEFAKPVAAGLFFLLVFFVGEGRRFFAGDFVLRSPGSELYGALSSCAGHASSGPGSHLRRRLPASVEPGFMDEPKKRFRAFLYGPSILGRLPGFFCACHSFLPQKNLRLA
ncbi:MAG: hypothetical protein VZQ47_05200 [Treponema sp.]|nr:hypothetical protein [Treponema sp.]MEE3434931.1 hypothetical protein [Treponema sp.]